MLLSEAEDHGATGAMGEPGDHLAQSETLSTRRRSLYGTWETSGLPDVASSGRTRKGYTVTVSCTVLRSRTTLYYLGNQRTTTRKSQRSRWREGC